MRCLHSPTLCLLISHCDWQCSDFWVSIAQSRFLHESHTSVDEMDRDMAGLAEALRQGHSRRNRMTLASCIPPEILAVIFEFVKQESFGEYEDMGDKDRGNGEVEESKVKVMGWITFSVCSLLSVAEFMRGRLILIQHICQRWRQVRSSPSLRSYIADSL